MLELLLDSQRDKDDFYCLTIPCWDGDGTGKSFLDIDNYPFLFLGSLNYDYVDTLIKFSLDLLFDKDVVDHMYYDMRHYTIIKKPVTENNSRIMMNMFYGS